MTGKCYTLAWIKDLFFSLTERERQRWISLWKFFNCFPWFTRMDQHFINSNYNKSALLWFVLEKKMHHRNNNTATVVHMLHTDHGVKYSLFKSPDRRNIYLKHFCFFVYVNSSGRSRKIYLYLIIKNMPPHTRACPNAVFTEHCTQTTV